MKTVLFIPGYQEDLNSRNYSATLRIIEEAGYKIKFVPIKWARTTIVDWAAEFNKEYLKYESSDVIVAGFSFGAMTAFVASATRNPSALWLFSLSPYFAEDDVRPEWGKGLGVRRMREFNKLEFNRFAKKIHCPVTIFIGEDEAALYPELDFRFMEAKKRIGKVIAVRVNDTGHDVSADGYLQAIKGHI